MFEPIIMFRFTRLEMKRMYRGFKSECPQVIFFLIKESGCKFEVRESGCKFGVKESGCKS